MSPPWPPERNPIDSLVSDFWTWGIGDDDWEDDDWDEDEDLCFEGVGEVWCPEFRHRIGITERNSGVCRFCVSEGFQEALADA